MLNFATQIFENEIKNGGNLASCWKLNKTFSKRQKGTKRQVLRTYQVLKNFEENKERKNKVLFWR